MNSKKHTILPSSIKIQLKDFNNKNIEIENVLCHLNVYIDSSSYYTFSFIPTNSEGKVILTKEEIIKNTELKNWYDENLVCDNSPVKFEFYIIGKETLEFIIPNIERYLKAKPKSIGEDLRKKKFSELQISVEIPKANKKQKKGKEFYDFLMQNNNFKLEYTEENSKIIGLWSKEEDYTYEIKIKQPQ